MADFSNPMPLVNLFCTPPERNSKDKKIKKYRFPGYCFAYCLLGIVLLKILQWE
jgi:hypothetical protein